MYCIQFCISFCLNYFLVVLEKEIVLDNGNLRYFMAYIIYYYVKYK